MEQPSERVTIPSGADHRGVGSWARRPGHPGRHSRGRPLEFSDRQLADLPVIPEDPGYTGPAGGGPYHDSYGAPVDSAGNLIPPLPGMPAADLAVGMSITSAETVSRYQQATEAAWTRYRAAADEAWTEYRAATAAAGIDYQQAITAAGAEFRATWPGGA